ncbi:IS701 family transposase [Saccharothrix syringae]|uniref:IS701 family transposase n=1 Tax=Saccharothrix syringae TaxID=103733 RepID=UPI000AC618AC|nr:IS701 family transposase [Saccharothrix syringae]
MTVRDIAGRDAGLEALTDGLGWLFNRPEPRATFGLMVRALLADVPRKNSWGLAEHAGLATPRPAEHLLDGAVWDVEVLRDRVRDYVVAGLGAVVVADDTLVVKKGDRSVGVAPQHCGVTDRTENCQLAPMLTYATEAGHAFVDRELYLPRSWTSDPARCRRAGVPPDRGFASKPALVRGMLARLVAAGVPFGWFAADSDYGRDPGLRAFCHEGAIAYVMAVPADLPLVDARRKALCCQDVLRSGEHRWERRSAGEGGRGARWHDWAMHAVTVKEQPPAAGFDHTLLIRRSKQMHKRKGRPSSYDIEFFLVHAPVATPMAAMVRAAGVRWWIEEDNRTGEDRLGLGAYQVASGLRGTGTSRCACWHRHSSRSRVRAGEREASPTEGEATG